MADRPLTEPLAADLPEDWSSGQIVAPSGTDVGLSEQHGYNYLMRQVNAARQAINTINEGFETISGKRTCTVVVGTSAGGWTEADCDYLCDGADDDVEINQAIEDAGQYGQMDLMPSDLFYAIKGGTVLLLPGVYNISSQIVVKQGITLKGSGRHVTKIKSGGIDFPGKYSPMLTLSFSCLSDLNIISSYVNFDVEPSVALVSASGSTITNCSFSGGQSVKWQIYHSGGYIDVNSCLFGGGHGDILESDSGPRVRFCDNYLNNSYGLISIKGGDQAPTVLILNNYAGYPFELVLDSISSNSVISGNYIGRLELFNTKNLRYASMATRIIANAFRPNNLDDPIIKLGENTGGNFITGNQFTYTTYNSPYTNILSDEGSGNIVRFNSDDTGSGGSGGAGVSSFNGRSGAVTPRSGDYTADMVGARANTWTPTAADVGAIPTGAVSNIQTLTQAEYDALAVKDPTTLYLIKE